MPALRLSVLSHSRARGVLSGAGLELPCAIGRSGVKAQKREGDGATPRGLWRLIEARYRRDRGLPPRTGLPLRPIARDDGWCDATGDRNYNRPVQHPYPASAEAMWRADRLYDLVVVTDHNRSPRVKGHGSAIFLHVARDGFAPTAGCLAFRSADLRRLIARVGRGQRLALATRL